MFAGTDRSHGKSTCTHVPFSSCGNHSKLTAAPAGIVNLSSLSALFALSAFQYNWQCLTMLEFKLQGGKNWHQLKIYTVAACVLIVLMKMCREPEDLYNWREIRCWSSIAFCPFLRVSICQHRWCCVPLFAYFVVPEKMLHSGRWISFLLTPCAVKVERYTD
jgi:hypothetical protein